MKSMICHKEYKDKENFEIDLKDYGHDLIKLRNKILENYKALPQGRNSQEERRISELKEDYKFIHEDNELTKILEILSWYGLGGRYYNLDYITSKKIEKNKKNPEFEMDELIKEFLGKKDKNLYNKFTKPKDEDEDLSNTTEVWREVIQKYINPKLKDFLGALSRQFSYGVLGNRARECREIDYFAYNFKIKKKI